MNSLDNILQSSCPTVMVALHGEMEWLRENRHRFLAASNGLWLEVKRPWLHAVWPLALQNDVAMPYGHLEKKIEFSFGSFPIELIHRFIEDARDAFPMEFSAWLVYNETTSQLEYLPLKTIDCSVAHINVERPALPDGKHFAVDLHSHGEIPAFFSSEDNEDDRGEYKISGVIGEIMSDSPTSEFRFCLGGLFLPLRHDRTEIFPETVNVYTL